MPRGPTDKASARSEHAQLLLLLVRPTDREAGAAASPTRTVHHRGAPRGSPTIAMGLDDGRSGHPIEKLDTVASKPTERPSQRDSGGAQLGAAGERGSGSTRSPDRAGRSPRRATLAAAAAQGNFGPWALGVTAATAVAGRQARQARQGSGSESTSAVASAMIAHRHPEPCTPLGRRTKSLERRPKQQPGRPKPQPQPPPTTRTLVGGTPRPPESESLTGRRAFTCTLSSPRASGSQRTKEATRR